MAVTNPSLRYKRLLIKLSGEALLGADNHGIDMSLLERLAKDVGEARDAGCEVCLVVGGGNIVRGMEWAARGMERATADYMGMLGTVINALAFQNMLELNGVPARVLSAIPMPTVCEAYVRPKALHHMERGRVVIFAAGTGNPYFTTDTTAVLRGVEMGCDAVAKATQVDGVYSADPKKHPDAVRYDSLSYDKVLADNLQVMDMAAIALARDNAMPILVFSIGERGNIAKVLRGDAKATVVAAKA